MNGNSTTPQLGKRSQNSQTWDMEGEGLRQPINGHVRWMPGVDSRLRAKMVLGEGRTIRGRELTQAAVRMLVAKW
jgi:hypothetical protein